MLAYTIYAVLYSGKHFPEGSQKPVEVSKSIECPFFQNALSDVQRG